MCENILSFDRDTFNSAIDAHVRCGDLDTARTIADAPEYKALRDARGGGNVATLPPPFRSDMKS
jgi:hypothetical protein